MFNFAVSRESLLSGFQWFFFIFCHRKMTFSRKEYLPETADELFGVNNSAAGIQPYSGVIGQSDMFDVAISGTFFYPHYVFFFLVLIE